MCPHLLRYVAVCVVTSPQRRSNVEELARIIQQESYAYKDPVTELIECLNVRFDFDGAQSKVSGLCACGRVCVVALRVVAPGPEMIHVVLVCVADES